MNQKHFLLKVKKFYIIDRHSQIINRKPQHFGQRKFSFQIKIILMSFSFLVNHDVVLIKTINTTKTGYVWIYHSNQLHLQIVYLKVLVYYHFPIKPHLTVQIVHQWLNEQLFHHHLMSLNVMQELLNGFFSYIKLMNHRRLNKCKILVIISA